MEYKVMKTLKTIKINFRKCKGPQTMLTGIKRVNRPESCEIKINLVCPVCSVIIKDSITGMVLYNILKEEYKLLKCYHYQESICNSCEYEDVQYESWKEGYDPSRGS